MWLPTGKQPSGNASTLPHMEGFLLLQTNLDAALISAYRETDYRVTESPAFTLRVDTFSPDLQAFLRSRKATCAAFLTACNPFSQSLSDSENEKLQLSLANELTHRSLDYLEGIGQHPLNHWPGEPSFLVIELALEAAKTLGKLYQQNAFIWSDSDAIPRLVLLR